MVGAGNKVRRGGTSFMIAKASAACRHVRKDFKKWVEGR